MKKNIWVSICLILVCSCSSLAFWSNDSDEENLEPIPLQSIQNESPISVEWKKSFNGSWKEIKEIGFDINFKRLWEYYLCYCEGGFKSGNINVGQFLIGKE